MDDRDAAINEAPYKAGAGGGARPVCFAWNNVTKSINFVGETD